MVTIDPQAAFLERFQQVAACRDLPRCREDDPNLGRRDIRLGRSRGPQPGFVGPGYARMRLLLIGRSPGADDSGKNLDDDRELYALLAEAVTAEGTGAAQAAMDYYGDFMTHWPIFRELRPAELAGLDFPSDIAFVNAARCPTMDSRFKDVRPLPKVLTRCVSQHLSSELAMLAPEAIICLGKDVYEAVGGLLERYRGARLVDYINRIRSQTDESRTHNNGVRRALQAYVAGRR